MKILVSGSSGLIGSALVPALASAGHAVKRLVRRPPAPGGGEVRWDPEAGGLDAVALGEIDAAVHLAGESIVGRWSAAKKRRIRDSRVKGTQTLAQTLTRLARPPRALVCASAIGYYGNRGSQSLREDSPRGTGFLAEVCAEWEAAARPVEAKGIRVVSLRIGVVLSPKGGALAKMLLPFRLGLGGIVGSGRQSMSWVSIDDVVGIVQHVLASEALRGPVNTVAPNPVTNLEFTRALGKALRRPTIFPMPAFAARLAFGEMADELLLASARVEPAKLLATRYSFRHPRLEGALSYLLGARR